MLMPLLTIWVIPVIQNFYEEVVDHEEDDDCQEEGVIAEENEETGSNFEDDENDLGNAGDGDGEYEESEIEDDDGAFTHARILLLLDTYAMFKDKMENGRQKKFKV